VKKNTTKRFFSLMLSVALVFAMMPMGVFATTGTSAPESADGVYQLKTADDLYWFAGLVNGSLSDVEQDVNASAVICNDIQVNADVLDEEGGLNTGTYKAWIPMGSCWTCAGAWRAGFFRRWGFIRPGPFTNAGPGEKNWQRC